MIQTRLILRIAGHVPSKSNTYRIAGRKGGGRRLVKDEAVAAYEHMIALRCRILAAGNDPPIFPLDVKLELWLVWHRERHDGRRRDLDNIYKAVKDGLTAGGVWSDDSQVTTHYATVRYDAEEGSEWLDIVIQPDPAQPRSSRRPRRRSASAASTS